MISAKFKGKNFMTPHVIEYGETENYIYELSWGHGSEPNSELYGVTVLNKDGSRTEGLSTCFNTEEQAKQHIQTL